MVCFAKNLGLELFSAQTVSLHVTDNKNKKGMDLRPTVWAIKNQKFKSTLNRILVPCYFRLAGRISDRVVGLGFL